MPNTKMKIEIRVCEICHVNDIPWLERAGYCHRVSRSQYLKRPYCDDECKEVLIYQRKWTKFYEDWAKEILAELAVKVVDSWLYAPRMLIGCKYDTGYQNE